MRWLAIAAVLGAAGPAAAQAPVRTAEGNWVVQTTAGWRFVGPPAAVASRAEARGVERAADALSEVNAKRAARGLPPFAPDPALTAAASAAAAYRASHRLFGHTNNDFAFLPPGANAASAGCAAYPPSLGWMSCDVYDNYRHAGAAWAMGADGKRYMHLFVR